MRKHSTIKIPQDMVTGTRHITRNYGELAVLNYRKAIDVDVRFVGYSHIVNTTAHCVRIGNVKNVMLPNTKGGFLGIGKYSENSPGRVYYKWKDMLTRCYCKKYHSRNPAYLRCSVVDEWFNFQLFAEWVYNNSNYSEGLHLDKDLKIQGNKVYSPDTCLFVSRDVNNAIEGREVKKGAYPTGVSFSKNMRKFEAYCTAGNRTKVSLGYFDTAVEASKVRNIFKKEYINKLSETQSCEYVKEALLRWEVGLE